MHARTSGGQIRVERVRGTVDAGTSGGGIEIATIAGDVRAGTSGGGITIEATSGDVSAETSGGGIRVRGAGGRVEAHTSGGPITVNFAPGNARGGELSTSGGGVTAAVDPAARVVDRRLHLGRRRHVRPGADDPQLLAHVDSRRPERRRLAAAAPHERRPIQISAAQAR